MAEVVAGGELVAGLCLGCDAQLPAAWFSCQHGAAVQVYVDREVLGWRDIGHSIRFALLECPSCSVVWWRPVTVADWMRWI